MKYALVLRLQNFTIIAVSKWWLEELRELLFYVVVSSVVGVNVAI